MNLPAHGSNPQYLFSSLNIPLPERRIDFSANINPLGPPPILQELWEQSFNLILDYPDPNGQDLKRKLVEKEGIEESELLIGNGGAEIISLIGRLLTGKKILIVEPTFSEYEEACRMNGCSIEHHQLNPDKWELKIDEVSPKLRKADALFLCNPCNPTGIYYSKQLIEELLVECRRENCLFIIDEAFYDFLSDYESIVHYIREYENLLIIRSMTKMYAIPGLRLGYVMGNKAMVDQIAFYQPQWSMNALALKAGEWCLESDAHLKKTRALIEVERDRLFCFYEEKEFIVSPSRVNFYLLRDPMITEQFSFFQFLISKGMIPRHTLNFPGLEGEWLRFAIKGSDDNNKLMEAITEWRNQP